MVPNVSCIERLRLSSTIAPTFEVLLPTIERMARRAFRFRPSDICRELVAEVIARAYVMYRRLVDRGRVALAYSTALARFAIRQVKSGRRLGSPQNVRDLLAEVRPATRASQVVRWSRPEPRGWEEVIADPRASPADIAICRVDFSDWLNRLGRLKRAVAERLASGDTTSEAAHHFRVSPGRISQLRRELHADWAEFQGACAAL